MTPRNVYGASGARIALKLTAGGPGRRDGDGIAQRIGVLRFGPDRFRLLAHRFAGGLVGEVSFRGGVVRGFNFFCQRVNSAADSTASGGFA